jgi:hypothetical protein
VVVSNIAGSVVSKLASLTVLLPPTTTITAPPTGATYNWGQSVSFAGTATDSSGATIPASQLFWTVFFFREDKADGTGFGATLVKTVVGAPGGSFVTSVYDTTPLAWYRVYLTAVDSQGGVATTFNDVRPNLTRITLASNVPGLPLILDGKVALSGTAVMGVVGEPRVIAAASPLSFGGRTYTFASWSDGGAAVHVVIPPAGGVSYLATYTPSTSPSLRAASLVAAPVSPARPGAAGIGTFGARVAPFAPTAFRRRPPAQKPPA